MKGVSFSKGVHLKCWLQLILRRKDSITVQIFFMNALMQSTTTGFKKNTFQKPFVVSDYFFQEESRQLFLWFELFYFNFRNFCSGTQKFWFCLRPLCSGLSKAKCCQSLQAGNRRNGILLLSSLYSSAFFIKIDDLFSISSIRKYMDSFAPKCILLKSSPWM